MELVDGVEENGSPHFLFLDEPLGLCEAVNVAGRSEIDAADVRLES